MNKETIVAEAGLVCEPVEKTSTHIIHTQNSEEGALRTVLDLFDKLVTNDALSYLPNLYLRQYRLIDELIHLRQDFPEQKLLVERNRTQRDTLLQDALFASRIFQERRKLKIATTSNLARQLRLEVQRGQLRAEEQYHFHRLTSTYLAESVLETFRKASEPLPVVELQEQPQERQQGPKKNQDDIFMNEEQYNYPVEEPDDLLDDLLAVDPGEAPNIALDHAASQHVEPLSVYLSAKYAERKEAIDSEPEVSISRKATLKRINENVRKRLKYKEEEEQQVGRSLSSATVFLSNLLNMEPEAKATILNQPLNTSEWLFVGQKPRKKKDEDSYDLRWSLEQLQKMEQRNEKNGLKKGKLDSGVLMLTLPQNEEEYRKAFEKQITGDKSFPPTLRNVVDAEPQRRPKYYNQFHDKEYQMFVTKYNKKRLFQKFSEKASMIFPENYSQDDVEDAENISTGRLFIYKPEKMLKRVVFLKEQRAVKTYLRSEPKNSVDQPRALLLAFLVERYLKEFGNNWKNIAQLICRHIAFAHKHVTVQFVQEIYQMVGRLADNGNSIPSMELWDKKILPFSCNNTQSYTSYHPDQHGIKNIPNNIISNESKTAMKAEDCPITPDYYKKLIAEEVEEIEESPYQSYEEQFQEFIKPLKDNLSKLNTNGGQGETEIDKISKILEMYVQSTDLVAYETEDQFIPESSSNSRHQILTENLKGEIKVGTPYRKKKSINERNNQLVKILQALRNKTVPNTVNPLQKKPDDAKPNGQMPAQKVNSIASSAPPVQKPAAEAPPLNADPKKSMKSPQKPDKKLGAPSKNKKTKDGEQKK